MFLRRFFLLGTISASVTKQESYILKTAKYIGISESRELQSCQIWYVINLNSSVKNFETFYLYARCQLLLYKIVILFFPHNQKSWCSYNEWEKPKWCFFLYHRHRYPTYIRPTAGHRVSFRMTRFGPQFPRRFSAYWNDFFFLDEIRART